MTKLTQKGVKFDWGDKQEKQTLTVESRSCAKAEVHQSGLTCREAPISSHTAMLQRKGLGAVLSKEKKLRLTHESRRNIKKEDVGGILVENSKDPEKHRTEVVTNVRYGKLCLMAELVTIYGDFKDCDHARLHRLKALYGQKFRSLIRLCLAEAKQSKLNPRYVGPFKVLTKRLEPLLTSLSSSRASRVYNTIMYPLEEMYSDDPLVVSLEDVPKWMTCFILLKRVRDRLPVEIMDGEVKTIEVNPCPNCQGSKNSSRAQEFKWNVKIIQEEISTSLHQDRTIIKCRVISLEDKAHLTGEYYNT
ncbi:hypothetical protein Tco_1081762 [Tanacetum coccineum]|uniref:Uncharacterized protein n=1 Tax=Tanacetum coccineum TaxID=301880 RepID=A0ABQ5I0K6_9ASTR